MTKVELLTLFSADDGVGFDEYLKFDKVTPKLSERPEIHAFLLLDQLVPQPGKCMIVWAEHDEIGLNANPDQLAAVITKEQAIDLIRCGVRYNEETDGLAMFR